MSWLIITITAYFFLALSAIFDKYLLKSTPLDPELYAFYLGLLGMVYLLVLPFGFVSPSLFELFLSLTAGGLLIFGLLVFYQGIKKFEVSRFVPANGALVPIFIFFFNFFFFQQTLEKNQILALLFLITAMFLIALEKKFNPSFSLFLKAFFSAFMFAVVILMSKIVYRHLPFLTAFVLMRLGGIGASLLLFIFSSHLRKEVLKHKRGLEVKTGKIFFFSQISGGLGFVFQNLAFDLVPLRFLPFVSAFEGLRYLFIFLFTLFLSLRFPKIIKEKLSGFYLFKKLVAILFIFIGLFLLNQ